MTTDSPFVIRESSGVIAVWKPAGLATQAPSGIPSVESWLRQRLHGGDAAGYVGVPHRLDRGVSGVVLFAGTRRAARKLSRQFERREVSKTYLAIVDCGDARRGVVDELSRGAATWRDLVAKITDEARARIVHAGEQGGREAVTIAALRDRLSNGRLLLELSPVTGRMHQLRLQAADRGLPILGDDLYGLAEAPWMRSSSAEPGLWAAGDEPRHRPIALHARRITYTDPDTQCEVTVEAALPGYWPELQP